MNENIVSIKNLKVKYGDNSEYTLKGIDLDVKPGQIVGYIGPNGAGKSTTVKVLLGLLPNYEGDVFLFGKSIKEDKIEYKKRIGYVPETAEIYENLTACEYLSFLGDIYGLDSEKIHDKAKKLLALFNIDSYYNTRIDAYSKGMKQKLLIVSSLIHNPDLLFFDEPLSGLDANSVMIFKEILDSLSKKGKTVFYSSHIMDVVEKISDRILLISDGIVIADGTFEELKNRSHEGSLEEIFNQLTGFDSHKEIADEFVSIIEEV